jgi:hypothetical protein
MKNLYFRYLLIIYTLVVVGLFLYSFTQIDLNLTLSRVSIWQSVQKKFMYIGYFERPLSTQLYLIMLTGLFTLYSFILYLAYQANINARQVWTLIGVVSAILFLSYPAFSHDIFNYLFSAKTIIEYGQLPYKAAPLSFPNDPWLNFMRWTHIPGTYPPLWILTTLPFYILGFNKLIPLLLNVKLLVLVHYLGSIYITGKIMEKINFRYKIPAMVFLGLNPLIIIESLVSAHNDIVMAFWGLLGFYLLQKDQRVYSFLMISISVGMKWMSVFLLPLLVIGPRRLFALLIMTIGLGAVLTQREFLPWYFVWILPFVALNVDRKWIVIPAIGLSLGLLLRYTPFIYLGHWDPPVPEYKFWLTIIPITASVIIVLLEHILKKLDLRFRR